MSEVAPSQGDWKAVVMMDLVKEVSQFMVELRHATQHLLNYRHGTVGYGLRYVPNDGVQIQIGQGVPKTGRVYQDDP